MICYACALARFKDQNAEICEPCKARAALTSVDKIANAARSLVGYSVRGKRRHDLVAMDSENTGHRAPSTRVLKYGRKR